MDERDGGPRALQLRPSWNERVSRFVTERPKRIVALTVVLGVIAVPILSGIRFDASVDRLTAQDDPAWNELREAKRIFGTDEIEVIAQIGEDSALDSDRLDRLRTLSDAVRQLPEVEHVWSLADARALPANTGSTDGPALAVSAIQRSQLLSRDGQTAAILIFPKDRPEDPLLRARLITGLRRAIAAYPGPEHVVLSGSFVVSEDIGNAMQGNIIWFSGFTVALLAIMLWIVFRQAWAVVLPLAACGLATVVAMVLMTASGRSIQVLTMMTPSMILGVGMTYALYLLEQYRWALGDSRDRARTALAEVLHPVLVSAITTMVGFGSLAMTDIPAVREFSVLSLVGVGAVTAAVLILLPAFLAMVGPALARPELRERSGGIERFLNGVDQLVLHRSRAVVAALAALLVVSAIGLMRLEVDTSFFQWLPQDHPSNRDYNELSERLAGLVPLFVVIDSGEANGALEPKFLTRLAALQQRLGDLRSINTSLSLADVVKEVNRGVHGAVANPDAYYAIPASRGLVDLCVRRYISTAPTPMLERLVSPDRRWVNIWVRSDLRSSQEADRTADAIRALLLQELPELKTYVTGTAHLLYRSANEVALGQLRGLGITFAAIAVTLLVTVRSVRLSLIAIPTNLLPLVVLFGVMGWCGVTLNMSTSLLACVCLGVVVDDTVHFILHYRDTLNRLGDVDAAMRETFRVLGRAVLLSSVMLSGSFLVFTLSSFRPVIDLGWLSGLTFMSGLATDVLFLPILLRRFGPAPELTAVTAAPQMRASAIPEGL